MVAVRVKHLLVLCVMIHLCLMVILCHYRQHLLLWIVEVKHCVHYHSFFKFSRIYSIGSVDSPSTYQERDAITTRKRGELYVCI